MCNIEEAKEILLKNSNYTCVFCNGADVITSGERGIKPLLDLLSDNISLDGYYAADRVVGKAAALLYVCLRVKEVYAEIISEQACSVFDKYNIKTSYLSRVPFIINRAKNGKCIMESAVWDIDDPKTALTVLKDKYNSLN